MGTQSPVRVVLSGAIGGHEKEAEEYFAKAEQLVRARYPLASVFNPMRLPTGLQYEQYMTACLSRINNWATHLARIENELIGQSGGAARERVAAINRGLTMLSIREGKLYE